jgi:hypothetical protein
MSLYPGATLTLPMRATKLFVSLRSGLAFLTGPGAPQALGARYLSNSEGLTIPGKTSVLEPTTVRYKPTRAVFNREQLIVRGVEVGRHLI